ncbi:MAG: oxidoreductase [Blautia sp.]|nr:oxidoreductase [Blautia sp.]
MTEHCLKSISPDGITGMIFAMEGLKDSIVLLNGPMGCRFYHSSTSGFLAVRPLLYLPEKKGGERVPVDYNYLNDWFFRQERVPCTYLDGYDYVYGTKEKVQEALCFIRENIDFRILAIINSPGAALIGDHLLELARELLGEDRVVMLESPGYSISFEEGYSIAACTLLSQIGSRLWEKSASVSTARKSVNLLGISIWNRYCEGDIKELCHLFDLCGIDVHTVLCAGTDLSELESIYQADLNVVLCPEMGFGAAQYLKEQLHMPYYVCELLPIGFSATEKMFADICGLLGTSDKPVKEVSERARAPAWKKLDGIYQMYGKPKGVTFCIVANPSQEKAYEAFLTQYLGMEKADADSAELVFSNANIISELKLSNKQFCGIEIAFPGMGYVDLTVKTHYGIKGALFLIEQVLNGMMSKL